MPVVTRRTFLTTSAATVAGMGAGVHPLVAEGWPARAQGVAGPAAALLPMVREGGHLQQLASTAIDAARSAGASYADVRVADLQTLELMQVRGDPAVTPDIQLEVNFTYGIRVLVDGAWAFAYGTLPSADAVAAAARGAVASAKSDARIIPAARRRGPLAPAPVVTGQWTSPCRIDPFTVPVEDQIALLWACQQAAERVPGVQSGPMYLALWWSRETRVVASTEGLLVTQTWCRARPYFMLQASRGSGTATIRLPIPPQVAGYEAILIPTLQDQMRAAADDAMRLARLPHRSADVGRYAIVLDGYSTGAALGATIGQGLELDRVLGDDMDASGGSFLAPIAETLGAPLFSPLLNVTAGRTPIAFNAAMWDDEGVAPQEYPLVAGGHVVDYHTSRQTAPALDDWYRRTGRPLVSRGCAVAPSAANPVAVRTPHLAMASADHPATIEDLCRDVSKGLLVQGAEASNVSVNLQSGSASLFGGQVYEIEHGKVVRRINNATLQFSARALWRSLKAVGDASTVCHGLGEGLKGQPWITAFYATTAPAAVCPDISVYSAGGRG